MMRARGFSPRSLTAESRIRMPEAAPSAIEDELAAVVAAMASDDGTPHPERVVELAGQPVARAREGIERFLITDMNSAAASSPQLSQIPIMFETMDPENPKEAYNVLYLDGHTEYVRYNERFPITERVARLIADSR